MEEIENSVGKFRRLRGLSAVQLAAMVDVSRQTVYAIESGTYVPNTVVALKMARALGATVEELFGLRGEAAAEPLRTETASLLPGGDEPHAGQPVQLCEIDQRLVANAPSPVPWYFPAADAVMGEGRVKKGRADVQIFPSAGDFSKRLLIAGCDPGISVLSRHAQSAGVELVLAHRNSSQALKLLKGGMIHIAGTHLPTGKMSGNPAFALISFAVWEEGIVTARGNPKSIQGIEDFAREDISIVNREPGAGCRALLDSGMEKLGIPKDRVRGYGHSAAGHLQAAWEVRRGGGDCCIATRAAARAFGLGFIPLVSSSYDLAVNKIHLDLPAMRHLLETLNRSSFRRELEGLGGYDARASGELKE